MPQRPWIYEMTKSSGHWAQGNIYFSTVKHRDIRLRATRELVVFGVVYEKKHCHHGGQSVKLEFSSDSLAKGSHLDLRPAI